MVDKFLYEQLDASIEMGFLKKEIPDVIKYNLNPKYVLRHYQVDAFSRFQYCYDKEYPGKSYPLHFLFNMATGSGKTLIMAGLILLLYEKGFRNFLFFVNSTNIIEKTKDNFLNPGSIKYLFNSSIRINKMDVKVTPVNNFESISNKDINICFTTIQKLHSDLTTEKENAITYNDFSKHKIVLISDESHHVNVKTKAQSELFESWENTVEHIFAHNDDNLLLEFTATHDYVSPAMLAKYRNKVIIRYDLIQFRNDQFSKDVVIVQSDFNLEDRMLQALLLNQYKQEVAAKYRINLKPVILFKAQRTIAQSIENKMIFHRLIDNLTTKQIAHIRKSNILLVKKALSFFSDRKITDAQLVERLKRDFHGDYCLSVNEDNEKSQHQLLLNSLESGSNRIRAIFAVQKLNEGWDVLNLFDIVRCYEVRDTGRTSIGTTTLSEAQLIGRGARYYPFDYQGSNDRDRRKFDGNLDHELRVLEELHYHSINDSRYITEIRQALIKHGILDEKEIKRELKLKDAFKQTDFYRYGVIWYNDRIRKDYERVRSFADLGVTRKNYTHVIVTGHGRTQSVLTESNRIPLDEELSQKDIKISEIDKNIVQTAISRNPFYTYANLKNIFPHLLSIDEFISADKYLAGLEITFKGHVSDLGINRFEQLSAMTELLAVIEKDIQDNKTEYEGTRVFRKNNVRDIFIDKVQKFNTRNQRAIEDEQFNQFISSKKWYAFDSSYGTSEEKAFVRMLDRQIGNLQLQFAQIYLLRNEGHFKLYNFTDGQAFQPDYVLFLKETTGEYLIYQVFIEPKGKHLREHDKWKETFLKNITAEYKGRALELEDKKYRLVGVPFYNNEDENKFKESLLSALV